MSKVVVMLSVSLDGYIEGPGHDLSWHHVDEEVHSHFNEVLAGMGAFVDGRVTFEMMADFWPTADEDPDSPRPMVEFSRIWKDTPKILFSRTLESAQWATRIEKEVTPEVVHSLTQEFGDIAVGGADLAASFRELDLIDEYRFYVNPVLIGRGTPLFHPLDARQDMHLAQTRTFGNEVVLLRYERVRRQ